MQPPKTNEQLGEQLLTEALSHLSAQTAADGSSTSSPEPTDAEIAARRVARWKHQTEQFKLQSRP
jgi:hypothetical protein